MFYHYDNFGWYDKSSATDGDRMTDKEPVNKSLTTMDGEVRANWTGYDWNDLPYWTPTAEELNPQVVNLDVLANSVIKDGVEIIPAVA